jgi:LysM repeat protein
MYTRRADTGDAPVTAPATPSLAVNDTLSTAPAGGGPATPAAAPDARASESDAAAGAREEPVADLTLLHRQALEALMSGDELRGSLLLFRLARARTSAPEREDAVQRLAGLERAAIDRATKARAAGAAAEERTALTVVYLSTLEPARRAPVKARLDELATDLVFSTRPGEGSVVYVVKSGDSLARIAAKHNFPVEGIQLVNRLRGTNLRVGERLKIPRGPVEVLAVKGEFRLVLLFGGLYAREYAIGTGKEGCTPEESFTIEEKIKEPTWHSREGVFPFGHPKNILGTRWLGFRDTPEYKGFGIHGTAFPESIGKEASSGCIRMRNAEVEELFGFVPKGASVTIVR